MICCGIGSGDEVIVPDLTFVATAVLLEAVRAGTAPTAILTTGADAFFALASIVADVMYGKSFPVVALEPADFASLQTGEHLRIDLSGVIARSGTQPLRLSGPS